MPANEDNTYEFDRTHMGSLKVRVRRFSNFTVEDLVETRAISVASALRLEQRRVLLEKANPALQDITFFAEQPE
jgi:hypothetical protein